MKIINKNLTDEIVKLHREGKNNTEITKILNIQYRTVAKHLKNSLNYDAVSNMSKIKRKYSLNENFFENIVTEEQCYWLGFIFADGYVNNSIKPGSKKYDRHLKIVLKEIDIEHLENFKTSINSNKPIKLLKYTNGYYPTLIIYNKKIVEDLVKLGCVQGKTHKLLFPKSLSKEQIRHFIRGYFDGDGCITRSNKEKNNTCNLNITGRKEFLFEIQKIFNDELGLNYTKMSKRHKERKNDIYTIHYGGIHVMKKLKKYLYDESMIFLFRKFKKFDQWVK